MPKKTSKPGTMHLRIVEVIKRFPDGAAVGQIRRELEKEGLQADEQTYLDKRTRELTKWFTIEKTRARVVVSGKGCCLRRRPGAGWKFEKLRAYPPSVTKPTRSSEELLEKGGDTLDSD
ncbi:MAG: hypothetical protein WAV20_11065 [Blastocatellia bacterium]